MYSKWRGDSVLYVKRSKFLHFYIFIQWTKTPQNIKFNRIQLSVDQNLEEYGISSTQVKYRIMIKLLLIKSLKYSHCNMELHGTFLLVCRILGNIESWKTPLRTRKKNWKAKKLGEITISSQSWINQKGLFPSHVNPPFNHGSYFYLFPFSKAD